MRVLILGSGVIGVTSAWYLRQAGHEVTVIDRQPEAALETSFANAGQISPGYSAPWAGPGVPLKALKWMFQEMPPLRVKPSLEPELWRWMWQMLCNCNTSAYQQNKSRMLRVAEYSRDCFRRLRADLPLAYDGGSGGLIQLFRTSAQVSASEQDKRILDACQVPYEALDLDGIFQYEPALAQVADKLQGGLRLPGDETGDCFLFTQALAREAVAAGVEFRYSLPIEALHLQNGRIQGVQLADELIQADLYVLALGSYTPQLLKPLGLRLPVYPVKGYSLTLPVEKAQAAPRSTVMDETNKVAVTRLGDRVRVGGTAELCGYDLSLPESRRKNLDFVVSDLFPGAVRLEEAKFWTGLRPMTPDGTPVIGATSIPNLYLNTGHGTLGWTMSLGSGRLLADLISGQTPEIDPEGLSIQRYAK
ncbi:D-amino acid dehydrogenase [Nitrincola tapanii]|uniref:D-amino acid dehydrogenase n=1 Tax=Nitrincola tapanii TaxID=1708751 RepID=A0A5A9W277_9GAMM|nr:D-amino acid dehydrogenase [Nitrincola tapanii]KAA0874195.1 D-amino acid dehydrogenase [Nitrincola tapanii]